MNRTGRRKKHTIQTYKNQSFIAYHIFAIKDAKPKVKKVLIEKLTKKR